MKWTYLLLIACACEAPVYDERIGVEGVPIEAGALAGKHALVTTAADEADVPLLGKQTGGGMTLYLVEASFDAEVYAATAVVCQVINFDVAGLSTAVSDETVAAIPPMPVRLDVAHETGAIGGGLKETWALVASAADDDLPQDVGDPRIVDMENDGKPGATVIASGIVNGELYVVQRKTLTLSGVVRGPDEALGLIAHKKESRVLDATDDLLKTEAQRAPHPDPKESW